MLIEAEMSKVINSVWFSLKINTDCIEPEQQPEEELLILQIWISKICKKCIHLTQIYQRAFKKSITRALRPGLQEIAGESFRLAPQSIEHWDAMASSCLSSVSPGVVFIASSPLQVVQMWKCLLKSGKWKETATRYSPEPPILGVYQCGKTINFNFFKFRRTILNSYKPLWKPEGSGFGWACSALRGLNLSSSFLLFSIFVNLKPACISRTFTVAQLKLDKLML